MSVRTVIVSLMLTVLAALPLQAQWSGSVNFATGLGGMTGDKETGIGYLGHLLLDGDASVKYQTDKFMWKAVVSGKWEPRSNDNTRLNLNMAQTDQVGMEMVYKTVKTRPLQVGVRTEFDWKPSENSNYSARLSYRYKNDRGRNVSNTMSGTLDLGMMDHEQFYHYTETPSYVIDLFGSEFISSKEASCYYEIPQMDEHSVTAAARGEWKLSDKNLLQGSFNITTARSEKYTTWAVLKTDESFPVNLGDKEALHKGYASMYRITPNSIDMDFSADFHLLHSVRDDAVRFNWSPGLRFWGNHSLDRNSGASLVDVDDQGVFIWRDSLRLMENFNFLALDIAPFFATEFRSKAIEIEADYSLKFYLCRLNDDSRRQPLSLQAISPSGNSRFIWNITDVHKIGLAHAVGVDYPDYIKICWYDRTGGYADQLYRGNENLEPTMHSRYSLVYELKYKRFRFATDNYITRRINEIDQTWTNEEIEGRLYKVFHWVNSANSWSFGTSERFGWEGKVLKAGLGVDYNQSRRTAKDGSAVKNSSDWRVTADAEVNLGRGWLIGANAIYQSEVATFFTSFNEYWELDARVQKKWDKITLYFVGRDLLDTARQTTFASADGTERWVDVARENRRLFILGVQWNF